MDNFANNLPERSANQYLDVDMQSLVSERRDEFIQLLSPLVHNQSLHILRRHRCAHYLCMSGQALNNINDGQFRAIVLRQLYGTPERFLLLVKDQQNILKSLRGFGRFGLFWGNRRVGSQAAGPDTCDSPVLRILWRAK